MEYLLNFKFEEQNSLRNMTPFSFQIIIICISKATWNFKHPEELGNKLGLKEFDFFGAFFVLVQYQIDDIGSNEASSLLQNCNSLINVVDIRKIK